MPATYNGIGTTYYGKKNLQLRPGLCPHCSKGTNLSSYDTRLWFVVLYLPLIPLGRKRILDYCPLCTQHGAMPLQKWEEFKAESLTPLLAEFQARPNDPEVAEKLHAQLLVVGQHDEASRMGKLIAERFPINAKLLAYLGHATSYWGRPDEAAVYFEQAFAADPNLPEVRTGLASDHIRKGRLEEAHNLLRFLEKQPEPDLGPLLELAEGYQKAGRHRQALEVFSLITSKRPELAKDKAYRKMVRNSEKGRTPGKTLLPPGVGATLKWAAVILILAVGIFGSNYYISQNRTLYVLNGYDTAMQVEINGEELRVPKGSFREMVLAEGKYSANITGPITTNVPFVLSAGFFDRWLDSPAFILNPGAQAVVYHETTVYTARPAEEDTRGTFHLYFGRQFERLPDVDYAFEPFPHEIQMSSSTKRVAKMRIDLLDGPVENVFSAYLAEDPARAFELAEWRLETRPDHPLLLPSYVGAATAQGQQQRAEALVRKMVARRPVLIDWHRFYQEWNENSGAGEDMIKLYDGWLAENPDSASLHYLRGRLAPTRREAVPFYNKAIELDPNLSYGYLALAFGHSTAGEWPQARALLGRAVECAPDNPEFEEAFFSARYACGEFDALEEELKRDSANDPFAVPTAKRLHTVLVGANKLEEARRYHENYRTTFLKMFELDSFPPALDYVFFYAAGDSNALLGLCTEPNGLEEVAWQPLLEQGQAEKALSALRSSYESWDDPFTFLAAAVGLRHYGMEEEAGPFLKQALARLEKGAPEYKQLAIYLKQQQPPSLHNLTELSLQPSLKALALVNLAQTHPAQAPALLALARKLNIERSFPHHLIQSITSSASEK